MQGYRLSPEPISTGQRTERRTLLKMLATAIVVRVGLGTFIDASGFDTDLMQSWTRTLLEAPLDQFYAVAEGPDHLPGDLWFLWAIGHSLELIGLDNAPRGPFVALMKLVPAIADLVIAWELFVLVRRIATSRAALVIAAAFAFNPASVFLSSIWGQWDSLSMALMLGGVLVILGTLSSSAGHGPVDKPASPGDPSSLRSLGMTVGEARAGVANVHQDALMSASSAHRLQARQGASQGNTSDVRFDDRPSFRHSERSEESPGEAGPRSGRDEPRSLVSPASLDAVRAGSLRQAQDDGRDRGREEKRSDRRGVLGNAVLWPLAVPLLTWAVLIKPPLLLVAGLFVLYACVRTIQETSNVRTAIVRTAMAGMMALVFGVATASLLILPFDVGLPGMPTRWNVLERAHYALDLYPFTTLQAANIWMLKDAHLYRPSDLDGTLLGLTERAWGSLLLALAMVWIGGMVISRRRRVSGATLVLWAALATSYATFMLPTRVHERYFFPVMVLALALSGLRAGCSAERDGRGSVWSAIAGRQAGHHGGAPDVGTSSDGDPWTWRLAIAISVIFLVSLLLAYDHTVGAIRAALFDLPLSVLFRCVAVVNLSVFLITMAMPLWWSRQPVYRSR